MAPLKAALALLALCTLIFPLQVLEPVRQHVSDGDEIYLGEIGPGQTISISVDGRPKTGGMYGLGGAYELANVSALPEGWSAQPSDWAGIPLQVKITAAKDAMEGDYSAKIDVLDIEDEGLGDVSFTVRLKITHDVLDASLDSREKEAFSGQPASFYITVTNKASTGDVFMVSSFNVPKWAFRKEFYVPAQSSRTVQYEVASSEEESYSPVIYVESTSSKMINKTLNASVSVNPSLAADYEATNNGMIFFPAMSGILYALAGLIANIF